MADDGQVRIGIYVDNEGIKSSMDEAVRTVQEGTDKMSDAAENAGEKMTKSVSKGFDTAKLQQNFKEVEAQVNKFAKAIVVAATGFGVWINQSANSIDRIDKLSQKLGLSRKAFQELDYAAGQTGLTVESLAASMRPLVNAVNSGSDSFKKLGINVKDASGNLKSQEELFFEVVNKLADMPASVERSTLGFELLGRNFQTMAPLLNQGSAGIDALRKRFQELGIEVSDKTVDDFVEFNDTLSDFGKTLKNSFNNAIKGSIPQLNQFVESMIKMLEPGGQLYNMIGKLAEVLTNFVTNVMPPLIDTFMWILNNATLVAAGITAIAVSLKLLTGNWVGAIASGLIGIFSTVLISNTKKTAKGIDKASSSLKKFGDYVIDVNSSVDDMKSKVREIEDDLAGLRQEMANFDTFKFITQYGEWEKLTKNVKNAESAIKELNVEIEKRKKTNIEEPLQKELKTFAEWEESVKNAKAALEDFIATNTKAGEKFDKGLLSPEKLAEFEKLTNEYYAQSDALDSLYNAMGKINDVASDSDAFAEWSNAVDNAQEELKKFVAEQAKLQGGSFDETLLSGESLEKFKTLKGNVETATNALDSLNETLVVTKKSTDDVSKSTEKSEDSFEQWTKALAEAEKKLKDFIAAKSDLSGGFSVEALSQEDLATYNQLKGDVTKAQQALDSMNNAMRETNAELAETNEQLKDTDAFDKWTQAVKEAEKALKEFIAAHATDSGKFDIDALTDTEKEKFEQLKKAVSDAKEQLQSLQDATKDSTGNIADNLVNVADTIAQAWGRVGEALGNGIETTMATIVQGSQDLSDAAWGLADALTSTLSAVGDALIQAGIAKQVVENLGNVSGSYAIAMGLAIKAAVGSIKGLFDKLKSKDAGSYATGGIIGGTSYTGDRLLARVNSGEMILNRQQQRQLFALANGGGGAGTSSNIQIINNAGDQVTAEQSLDGRSIKIMVEKFTSNMLRGVKGSKLMGQTYGIRQLGRH